MATGPDTTATVGSNSGMIEMIGTTAVDTTVTPAKVVALHPARIGIIEDATAVEVAAEVEAAAAAGIDEIESIGNITSPENTTAVVEGTTVTTMMIAEVLLTEGTITVMGTIMMIRTETGIEKETKTQDGDTTTPDTGADATGIEVAIEGIGTKTDTTITKTTGKGGQRDTEVGVEAEVETESVGLKVVATMIDAETRRDDTGTTELLHPYVLALSRFSFQDKDVILSLNPSVS